VSNYLPLPIFVIDENDVVKFANSAAAEYLIKKKEDLVGRAIYDLLDMSFMDKDTLDAWLKDSRSSVAVAKKTWNRVKLNLEDGRATNQFDLAAYYNKGNANHFETILVLFDHTDSYGSDDDQANFLALAVHELRNPLTMLRGYIEVLEEEVDDKSNLEFTTDLQKMRASAQLLAEYTNNILNVSRVDSDQLNLHLRSEDWSALVSRVTESMILRARVHGMEIKTNIAPNLPPAGVDSVSISEVLMNLIDNAIKYGAKTKTITISSNLNQSGEIETTVNDRGSVIDSAVIGNLFQRFYRSHRTRSQANGTGLGLYLSKALVEAHGGNIWISSNENEGTTAGFTVLPYTRIADEHKSENGNDIVRVPHGWIKNHSLYRR
ncbi:MAG: ATP-binding protein, partial [Candidatus Saccharimonadales bacterium]